MEQTPGEDHARRASGKRRSAADRGARAGLGGGETGAGCPGSAGGRSPSAAWETWVQSLPQEDPLQEGMATPVFLLENPVDGGAWRLQPLGSERVGHA